MTSVTLAAEVPSIRTARHFVQTRLQEVGLDSDVPSLLTSELVANAVRHTAHPELTVVLVIKQSVRVEVHDGEPATEAFRTILADPPKRPDPTAIGGRGISIVAAMATNFGLGNDPGRHHGKIVWFALDRAQLAHRARIHPGPPEAR